MKAQAFLRPSAGAIWRRAWILPPPAATWARNQLGILNFRPLSDLGLALTLGAFLPSAAAFLEDQPQLGGQVELR